MYMKNQSPQLINSISYAKYIILGIIALALAMPTSFVALASGESGTSTIQPTGKICVDGLVIDHEENVLTDGWIVVATPYDDAGVLDPRGAIAIVSDGDGKFHFEEGLFPGRWQFAIELKEGWEPVTSDKFDVMLSYGLDGCLQVRFKVRRMVTVHVIKIDDDHYPLEGWKITATPGPSNPFAQAVTMTTDTTGTASFRLTSGIWVFTEAPPDNSINFEPVIPITGQQTVDVQPPGPITIRFKNRIDEAGCIEVHKYDIPPVDTGDPFGLVGWPIKLLHADGTLHAEAYTDAFGHVRFNDLPLGPYTVVEGSRVGWSPVTPSSLDVLVTGTQCQVVTFYNQQTEREYCIEGRKIDLNGGYGLPGWKITAEPLDPSDPTPNAVYTNGLGEYKFVLPSNDYRVPGSRYQVCEEVKDGWLNHSPICRIVTLPYEPGICVEVSDFENYQIGHDAPVVELPVTMPPPAPDLSHCRVVHIVQPGEEYEFQWIGYHYGVPFTKLLAANSWVYDHPQHAVEVGQPICVPYW